MNEVFKEIGLKEQETKIYLKLLELGETQTGELCKLTEVASSNIYPILDELIKKGLVSYKLKNNIKVFMPSSPEVLKELFKKKQEKLMRQEKEIIQIITNLKKIKIEKLKETNFKYFEGVSGIKGMWYELNQTMTPNNVLKIYCTKPEAYKNLVGFYNEHHNLRKEKNICEQMILPNEDVDIVEKRKNEITEIKVLDLKNQAEWGVIEDIFYMEYCVSKEPKGFLIKDKIIADTFKQVFDQIWESKT
ncbi:MAG: TrmB family transcriptional regulator [Candidatus Nanoarchaeia archaeon]